MCLWVCFLDLFFVFLDWMEIGFGCWIWIWVLLEIGLVASWIWEEYEENFLLVFNLIFSFCFCLCSSDMGLSSWLLGLCSCALSSWLLGLCLVMGFSSWLLGLVCEEHKEQVEEHEEY